MIKINLLPVRADKKKETARQQAIMLLGSLLIVLLVFLGGYSFFMMRISSVNKEIASAEQELADLKAKIGKIQELEKLKADVSKKLDVLNQLRRERTGPVNRLMALSRSTPDKLWLTRYTESGTSVTVQGTAFDEDLIAAFMRNIESSRDFENVDLIFSEQAEVSGMKLKKFELRFNLEAPK